MNDNFIQLMCWLMAYEFTRDDEDRDRHRRKFNDIYDCIYRTFISQNETEICSRKQNVNDTFDDHSEMGNKIIEVYKSQPANGSEKLSAHLEDMEIGNNFKIIKLVGEGSFGYVFEAMHKIDNEHYAIKAIQLKDNDGENAKILNEILILAKTTRSPNTVRYYTSWIQIYDDCYFQINNDGIAVKSTDMSESNDEMRVVSLSGNVLHIQMELCPMNLRDSIIKINNDLNQSIGEPITIIGAFIALQFFEEIANGVQYLHSSSPPIIHRDLKPENIFITDGGGENFIKIGDYGLSTFHGQRNDHLNKDPDEKDIKHTQKRGTYDYMAPEVRESTDYDESCDIYSLGCIAMDLFCIDKRCFKDDYHQISKRYYHHFKNEFAKVFLFVDLIRNMTSSEKLKRSRSFIADNKNLWKFPINLIAHTPQLRHIVFKDNLSKEKMIPLSDHIVISKLSMEKENEIADPDGGFFWNEMQQYRNLCNAIHSENFYYISNFEKSIEQKIIDVIKHAFAIHASTEMIRDFIEDSIQEVYDFGQWKCILMNSIGCGPHYNMKIINWKSIQHFHGFYSIPKGMCVYMIICKTPNEENTMQAMGISHNIILNSYNDNITKALIDIASDLLPHYGISDDYLPVSLATEDLDRRLKELLNNENVFGFIGINEDFLIFYENYKIDEYELMVTCQFAAMIRGLCISVWSYINKSHGQIELTHERVFDGIDCNRVLHWYRIRAQTDYIFPF